MKKIATLTYHAPYNYGGNLQAYALQTFIEKNYNNVTYTIINFRSNKQKELYIHPLKKNTLKNFIKRIFLIPYHNKLKQKSEKFESFIKNKLNITEEINNSKDLLHYGNKFDIYLCGSDQIWNPSLPDFDWAYFLEFVKSKTKVSYAVSLGAQQLQLSKKMVNRMQKSLKSFKKISVRDQSAYQMIKNITGIAPEINVDPTLLLTKEEWEDLVDAKKIVDKDYILYYDVKDTTYNTKVVERIRKKTKLPVVITRYSGLYSYFSSFKRIFNTGPLEFLNLIKNSKFVVTSSFHGVVFSIIFNKPFLVIDGMHDNRLKEILTKSKLEKLNISIDNCLEKLNELNSIDFSSAIKYINEQKNKTKEYFNDILD